MSTKALAMKDALRNAKKRSMGTLVISIGHEPDADDAEMASHEKEEGDKDWGLTNKRGLDHPKEESSSEYSKKRGLRMSQRVSRDDVIKKLLG